MKAAVVRTPHHRWGPRNRWGRRHRGPAICDRLLEHRGGSVATVVVSHHHRGLPRNDREPSVVGSPHHRSLRRKTPGPTAQRRSRERRSPVGRDGVEVHAADGLSGALPKTYGVGTPYAPRTHPKMRCHRRSWCVRGKVGGGSLTPSDSPLLRTIKARTWCQFGCSTWRAWQPPPRHRRPTDFSQPRRLTGTG